MNDHNLDDLIIDNIAPKNGKAKNILTIIALLIVVLIVAIILTKIILKDPNAEQLALEKDNSTEMISPELTLQNATKTKKTQETTPLSTIIESEPKAPVAAPKEVKEESVEKEVTVEKTKLPKEAVEITKEFAQVPTEPEIKQTVKKPIKEETSKIKEASKKEPMQTIKPVPSKIVEKAKERPTGKPVNVPKKIHATQGYFIQVGSFTQTPSSRFLSIIKNSGFNYTITPAAKNGTKKLLIGPYDNRKAVDTALVRVRDRINKQAFVIKK